MKIYAYDTYSRSIDVKDAIGETVNYYYVTNPHRRGGKERIAKNHGRNYGWYLTKEEALSEAIKLLQVRIEDLRVQAIHADQALEQARKLQGKSQ